MPRRPPRVPPALVEVARRQDLIVTRAQLRAVGCNANGVRNQVCAERWRAVGRHVVVLHLGPLSPRQRAWVGLLHAGSSATLDGLTAAELGGLRGWHREQIQVAVPHGINVPPMPGLVVRTTRQALLLRSHQAASPRRLIMPVALLSAAARLGPRAAVGLVAAGVQQRLVSAEDLLSLLAELPTVRHARLLREALHDVAGGAQALTEIDLGRLARRAGIPAPRRQAVRLDPQGRRRYLDAEFDGFSVEVDGALHLLPLAYWADLRRQNDLVLAGERLLRFPSVAMRIDQLTVCDQLRRASLRWGGGNAST